MTTGFKTKLIALLLAIAMLAELSPVGAVDLTEDPAPQPSEETVAEQEPLEELPAEAEEPIADEEEPSEPATVVGEITELREQNVKHFRMSDGTFTAVSYDQPVHYEDATGKWQDIDNSLKYCSTNRSDTAVYKTGEGSFGVSFAASLEDDLLFSTDDGAISLFWNETPLDEVPSDDSDQSQDDTDDTAKQVQASGTPTDDTVSKKVIEAEVIREKHSANTDDLFAAYVPGAKSSALVYEDILPDVDLKYETSAISIKESIVVHEPQDSYIYRFLLQLDGLTPVLEEGGHISLLDSDGAEQYVIPAPYMLDDNHDFCFGASYALEETEDDVWALTVTADEEWMNASNRAYPVIIDPTIVKRSGTANGDISSTYVEEGHPTVSHPSYQQLFCGKTTYLNTGYQDIYLHVNSLPSIPYNCTVTSAAVMYCQDGYSADDSSSSVYIAAYELTNEGGKTASQSYTNWIHNLTWNTRPANSTIAMDYAKLNHSTTYTYQSWDITQAAVKWYSDMNGNTSGNNHGILLKRCDTSGGNKGVLLLNYGSNSPSYFAVTYRSTVGIEDYYSYQVQSAGRAGTAYMGDFSGHLTVEVPLVSFDSAINSYNLSLYYNSATAACNFTGGAENEGFGLHTKGYYWLCGTGWKLSAQQTLYELELADFNNTTTKYIIYNDSDGTEHYFKYDSAKGKYFDEDGLNLQISKSGVTYTMQECPSDDAGANNSNFAKNVFYRGYLTEIHDNNDNAIYFLYNNGAYDPNSTAWKPNADSGQNLTKIIQKNKDASEETIATFTYYSGAHYLATVKDYADRVISFSYDSSSPKRLTQITWPDGQTTNYGYDSSHYRMNMLKDNECGYGLDLTYLYYNNSRVVNQVTEFTQSGNSTKLLGNSFHAYHHSRQMMEYRFYGADHTRDTDDDIVSRYTFDYGGHTINAVNLDTNKIKTLGVSTSSFTKSSGTSAKNHRMTGAAESGTTATNLLTDSGAEKIRTETINNVTYERPKGWSISIQGQGNAISSAAYQLNNATIKPHNGERMFKLYESDQYHDTWVYQPVYLQEDTTYTLSAYVNTMGASDPSFGLGGVCVAIQNSDGSILKKSKTLNYQTSNAIDDGWERISVTFSVEEPDVYNAAIGIRECTRFVAAFDDIQLEVADAQSTANLIQYGSFETVNTNGSATISDAGNDWSDSYGNNVAISTPSHHGSYCMRIWSDPTSQRRAYQDIPIQKDCNNTWLLSGWAKADSVANTQADPDDADAPDDRFFGLVATIYYSDNTTENHYVPFCDDYNDWQYTCGIVAQKKSNDDEGNANLKIKKIRVYTAYDYNCNTAWFDDISLRAEPVETYKYDKDGKLTAVNATKNSKDSYTYNGPDLTQATQGVTGTYTYHYDSRHNMDKATTNSNNTLDVTYDARGNAETSKWYVTNNTGEGYLQTGTTYSSNGNLIQSQTDANNITVENSYYPTTQNKNRLSSSKTGSGAETRYEYIAGNGSYSLTEQEDIVGLHYSYDQGSLCAISRESAPRSRYDASMPKTENNVQWQTYKFPTDSFGNPTGIYVSGSDNSTSAVQTADIRLATYTYDSRVNNGCLTGMTYGNGYSVSYTYDNFERVTKQENSDNTEYRYYYNSEGALARQESVNAAETVDEAYDFEYDSLGRLIRSRQTRIDSVGTNSEEETVQSTQHMYDEENRIISQSYSFGKRPYTENYSYNDNVPSNSDAVKDGSLHSVNYATLGRTETFTYDPLKHLQSASVDRMYQRSYSYHIINGNRSSNQISQLSYAANSSSLTPLSFTYTYDDRGNILTVNQGTSSSASYRYNSQNQLIEETVRSLTTRYTYDTAGNILSIADTLGLYPEKSFTYGNANWRDLLTSVSIGTNTVNPITKKIYYQGQTYNAATDTVSGAPISGNPLNWYNGTEYTDLAWGKDRQLTSITTGGMTADYAYDMNGIRRSKTVTKASGTEQHSYLTQNGQVVRETIGTGTTAKVLDFVYDNNGQPFALCYSTDGGETFLDYFYITNMQGDVVRLVNYAGTTVADYSYDAWGNLLSSSGTMASINPLRYRSYYYDTETGFYYLQSRYYDPAVGRFINADSYASTGQGFSGLNMFSYCNNNPTMFKDVSGTLPENSIWSFTHDKQGIFILWHWLYGNGSSCTFDGGEWGEYMQNNQTLTSFIMQTIESQTTYMTPGSMRQIDITLSAEIENGESIIGYQYLHGTNADVGGFRICGMIGKDTSGNKAYSIRCTWNDIIDPNLNYTSDQKKAQLAQFIPFAKPTDYIISISWRMRSSNYYSFRRSIKETPVFIPFHWEVN